MSINVRIVAHRFLDESGKCIVIGGIETYLARLIECLHEAGHPTHLYQISSVPFERRLNSARIVGVASGKSNAKTTPRALVRAAAQEADLKKDLLIFATDYLIIPHRFSHSIAIQHGVAWDVPKAGRLSDLRNILSILANATKTLVKYNRYRHCEHLVCVDHNFINWYRTQIAQIGNRIHVIPNFSHIPPFSPKAVGEELSILFARRFVPFRGTRLFANAVDQAMRCHANLRVTFAGEGPDEDWLRTRFEHNQAVRFICYEPADSLKIHQAHNIAVVPTLGSEGTSLSLLEAMAAGCAVIATNVGGLTNILLNGYNGLLIQPEEGALTDSLKLLITDTQLRNRLAEKGYETVKVAFSLERWKTQWLELVREIEEAGHGG